MFYSLKVKELQRETDDCVSVALEVPAGLEDTYAFTPGQYLTFRTHLNGEEVRRSYSICAGPADGELRVAVKKVPGGQFSTFANEGLQPGHELEVMAPMGKFTVTTDAATPKHYVAFAAGSGITPILSIMKAVLTLELDSQFTLFYGNRSSDSVIFREQLEGLKNKYLGRLSLHHILSRELTGSPLFSGRIDAEKCGRFCDLLLDVKEVDQFLLCGPYTMIEQVSATLQERGVPKEKIRYELFVAPGEAQREAVRPAADEPEVVATIRLTQDGKSFEFPLNSQGQTILEAALAAGADLPFACKGGVCSTCRARLTDGEVRMDVNYALEPDEVAAGYILTCQSHPRSSFVAIDYDG